MEKKHKLHLNHLFCCDHTCYFANIAFVTSASWYITSASCYHPRYQSRSSMYTRGLIPRISAEFAEAVPIESDAESVISVLVGPSRTATTITVAFCFVVSETPVPRHIQPSFVACEQKDVDQHTHPCSPISAFNP